MKKHVAVILSVGLIVAFTVFGIFFYNTRKNVKKIKVAGMAKKEFEADLLKWELTLSKRVGLNELKKGYKSLDRMKSNLVKILGDNDIKKESITINPINYREEYSRNGVSGYILRQPIFIITEEINKLEKMALSPSELVAKGVIIQKSKLNYFNSRLDSVKKEILSAAAKNAKSRAEKMVEESGSSLKKLISIRQGVFQITEPYSTEVSSRGIY